MRFLRLWLLVACSALTPANPEGRGSAVDNAAGSFVDVTEGAGLKGIANVE